MLISKKRIFENEPACACLNIRKYTTSQVSILRYSTFI